MNSAPSTSQSKPPVIITPESIQVGREWWIFLGVVLLISLFGAFCAIVLPKGSVWDNHLRDGLLFIDGSISDTPGYPMWGYSLLAGVLREYIVFAQVIFVLLVLGFWFKSFSRRHDSEPLALRMLTPTVVAFAIAPFIFLSTSYFSNALPQLLAFAGVWILHRAVTERRPTIHYALAGALFGLGYNFRAELLILCVLLFVVGLIYAAVRGRYLVKGLLAFVASCLVMTVPWLVYTNLTLNHPTLSSTNGGGAIYEGLGILNNNPWAIEESDEYMEKIAAAEGLGSPWSAESDKYFSAKYVAAAREYPWSFAKRVLMGWRYMLTQGVYLPKFRLFVAVNEREGEILNYVDQVFRYRFGLNAHEQDFARLAKEGIGEGSASLKHYLVVAAEYVVRAAYAGVFLAAFAACIRLVWVDRMRSFVSAIFLAYTGFLMFGSGFMQTNPRHTTIILPVFIFVILVLLRGERARDGSATQPSQAAI